jgi:hypothetical protein
VLLEANWLWLDANRSSLDAGRTSLERIRTTLLEKGFMHMRIKVALKLTNVSPREKLQRLKKVIGMMTGNANAPSPNPPLDVAQEHHDEAETVLNRIAALEQELKMLRAQRTKTLAVAMGDYALLGSYMQSRSGGNPSVVTSGGFELLRERSPVQPMPMVERVEMWTGADEGTAKAKWKRVKGVRSYEVQLSTDTKHWTHEASITTSRIKLTGKPSGTRMWIRVRAINKLGPGPWSDPACATIQ